MKKITISIATVFFAVSIALGGSFAQQGYYLWDESSQSFVKSLTAPGSAEIELHCPDGTTFECYFTLDETGTVKKVIELRD